jgi:pimeloyl-ACP methyl ester carboxylesterase
MPNVNIGGVGIEYEVIGDGARAVAITPGGRYSKDILGLRELALTLARSGLRVLIWDRPNCGASDSCFEGESESIQNADMLAGLLRALHLAPAVLVAGSGGSREALITAIRHPQVVERLFLFWISGGSIGLATLPFHYCGDSAVAAAIGGMRAVAELPHWKEQIARNPGNRERLLRQDPTAFIEQMDKWGWAFFPREDSPVPGLVPADLRAIRQPVMVLRSSPLDIHHPRKTSETVHAMIPGAHIAEPPWGEREFLERLQGFARGESAAVHWPQLAPQIVEFAGS